LFADEHDPGAAGAFTENGLRSFQPEIASLAAGGGIF
jgi:hypothetical protein